MSFRVTWSGGLRSSPIAVVDLFCADVRGLIAPCGGAIQRMIIHAHMRLDCHRCRLAQTLPTLIGFLWPGVLTGLSGADRQSRFQGSPCSVVVAVAFDFALLARVRAVSSF